MTNLFTNLINDKEKFLQFPPFSIVNPTRLFSNNKESKSSSVQTCTNGAQNTLCGLPESFSIGFISSGAFFAGALNPNQIRQLCLIGHAPLQYCSVKYPELLEVISKLVLYCDARGYSESENKMINFLNTTIGEIKVCGECITMSDIKDVLNCVGGLQVVFPILEIIAKMGNENTPCPNQVSPRPETLRPNQSFTEIDDWVVLSPRSCHYNELSSNMHPVAALLNLILKLAESRHEDFGPAFITYLQQISSENGLPIIGLLLQRLANALINVDLLFAIQQFVDEISHIAIQGVEGNALMRSAFKHLVFDFSIWIKGDFTTQIGHAQYLFYLIKSDRKYFRKEFGIQFLLDSLRYYFISNSSNFLNNISHDLKTVRQCLFRTMKYYLSKDVNHEEMNAIISFLISDDVEEVLIFELLETLLSVFKNRHVKDQIYLLFYEPEVAELLYYLLLNDNFSSNLKAKVLKLIIVLLKTDRVYEKSKLHLRLYDVRFSSFAILLPANTLNYETANLFMDLILLPISQVSISDHQYIKSAFEGAFILFTMIQYTDLSLKINMASKFMKILMLQVKQYSALISEILGWQESIASLLIKQSRSTTIRQSLPNVSPNLNSKRRHSIQTVSENSSTSSPSIVGTPKAPVTGLQVSLLNSFLDFTSVYYLSVINF